MEFLSSGVFLVVVLVLSGFAIGAFFALPMIWYHSGHTNKKLSIVISLLEDIRNNQGIPK